MSSACALVVEDEEPFRNVVGEILQTAGYRVVLCGSGDQAIDLANQRPFDVVISDVRLGDGADGMDVLAAFQRLQARTPVILMTAFGDIENVMKAIQQGAYDYISKFPFQPRELIQTVERALERRRLLAENRTQRREGRTRLREIVGRSPAMLEVYKLVARVAVSMSTVLVVGESGSGKELVAHALHRHSNRAAKAFIAINTAAIPRDLLESELFGHERGSFTGATTQRRGRFEEAEGGTLFLDEIGDMPTELQTRLLRVLSDGFFYRVGGHQPIKANVRVIAATHQNLEDRVKQGLFREDLFHRLNVIRLRLPPLRERQEDVPLLARHFLFKSAQQLGVEPKRLSDGAMDVLKTYPFPGNVRQLENICHWLTVMAPGQTIEPGDLPPEMKETPLSAPVGVVGGDWVSALEHLAEQRLKRGEVGIIDSLTHQFEAALIKTALAHTGGRRVEAAHLLGLGRNTLTRKIQELGIDGGRDDEAGV